MPFDDGCPILTSGPWPSALSARAFWVRYNRRVMRLPEPLITASPKRLGATPVFAGTRVPVQALIDHLEAGDPLTRFLEDYPSVTREHAVAVLELAKEALLARVVAA